MRVDIRQVSPLIKWMIRFLVSTSFMFFLLTRKDRWQRTKSSPNALSRSFMVLKNSITYVLRMENDFMDVAGSLKE